MIKKWLRGNGKMSPDKEWRATVKPNFILEMLALPPKETHQVVEKINLLIQDPTPDAKVKKQLKYMHGKLYRIRCSNYRIFYTFEFPYISLLTLRLRANDTYDEDLDPEFLGGFDPQLVEEKPASIDWAKFLQPVAPPARELPEPITKDLLDNLRVPVEYHRLLLPVVTEDDLWALSDHGVPDEHILNIYDYLFKRPLAQVVQQPDLMLQQAQDLARFKEGELLSFLLKLSTEQEKYVDWAMNATGPTLLKGGPGTGKSTIALYRVRSLVRSLRAQGLNDFRILFTTYTNALARSSRQLLEQLLGSDMQYVEVQTADKLVMSLLRQAGATPRIVDNARLNDMALAALNTATFEGSMLQQQAQRQALQRISLEYLLQEVCQVIIARQLREREAYLAATRVGRRVRLNALQREAIWQFYLALCSLLQKAGMMTWQQARALAADYAATGQISRIYDAVLIDEAQDLDPSVLRLLVRHCRTPNRLFITADANQSIYGSGFNWADVHADLRFQGRTGILRTNYRSTYEIGEATRIYLAGGALDDEPVERGAYKNNGPLPAVRTVRNSADEADLLARLLPAAARELRLSLNSCAILCPTVKGGHTLAAALSERGLPATFMASQELDLKRPGLKVLTLNSSKGLEFPVVALAGFTDSTWQAKTSGQLQAEERDEFLSLDRRTIFVGMTRAMRALLVLIPAETQSPLLTGFAREYWDIGPA